MKIGTQVKVLKCKTGHEFAIGEIVTRVSGEYDGEYDSVAFESEHRGVWYMQPDEYQILDYSEEALCEKEHAARYKWLRERLGAKVGHKTASVVFWLDEPYEPEDATELDRMIDNFLEVGR